MSNAVSIFLLDALDSKILNQAMLQVTRAGISADYEGEVSCKKGFDARRTQWRADILLSACLNEVVRKGQLSLIITERDLYATSLNFVFGLARRDLQAAIVSWHRLRDDNASIFADRLAKEIVHEVGHLRGLGHCPDPSCVMWFSNTLGETDTKGINFCHICRRKVL